MRLFGSIEDRDRTSECGHHVGMPKGLTVILLSVFLVLAIPPLAHAEEPPSACALGESVLCEAQNEEAEEAAKQSAQEAKKTAEQHASASYLNVTLRTERGRSYSEPGRTDIVVTTSPFAVVTFIGPHSTSYSYFRQLTGTAIETEYGELGPGEGDPEAGPGKFEVDWSCHRRGQTVHYTVQAQGGSGPPLVRSGVFTISLSARWCIEARRRERSEDERQLAERHASEHREASERAQRERKKLERYETNCRAIGGTPVEISTSEGRRIVCRSKTGGILLVPQ